MKNYLRFGSVGIRISRKGIARWGYPLLRIGGLDLISRTSSGELTLASYHPRGSATWIWSVVVCAGDDEEPRIRRTPADMRHGQWHDWYRLPFGRSLRVSMQDYHKR